MNKQIILFLGAVAAIAVIFALIFRPDAGEDEPTGTGTEQAVDEATGGERQFADTAEENMPEGVIPWEPGTAPFADLPQDQQDAMRADAETFLDAWVVYSTDADVMAERAETMSAIATEELADTFVDEGGETSEWEEKLAESETSTTGEVSEVAASEYHPEEGIVLMRADVRTTTETGGSDKAETRDDTYLMRFIDTGDGEWKIEACELVVSPPEGVGD